ncbi:hypothetical protein M3Y94_01106700 [Aphelenchoides besseyi]|nr:hypothetical protein M3Y94_01106700 [Aphelenchoides besseyi]KAI6221559.1 hypothetical protein M3Y95_00974900 [Aphelenchoides besseyi]
MGQTVAREKVPKSKQKPMQSRVVNVSSTSGSTQNSTLSSQPSESTSGFQTTSGYTTSNSSGISPYYSSTSPSRLSSTSSLPSLPLSIMPSGSSNSPNIVGSKSLTSCSTCDEISESSTTTHRSLDTSFELSPLPSYEEAVTINYLVKVRRQVDHWKKLAAVYDKKESHEVVTRR